MARLITPGLQFTASPIDPLYPPTGLYPTMSTYGMPNLEGCPKRNEVYVVCKDGSIQSVYEPNRPIGWELTEDDEGWWYRVTQMNHPRKRCAVWFHSRVEDPPAGRGHIGSIVVAARRIEEPQDAEITEQTDSDTEVSSATPGAPQKGPAPPSDTDLDKIARNLDPLLAQCAVILNDPVQTAAMAQFAEGKMSYAEMRSLCG